MKHMRTNPPDGFAVAAWLVWKMDAWNKASSPRRGHGGHHLGRPQILRLSRAGGDKGSFPRELVHKPLALAVPASMSHAAAISRLSAGHKRTVPVQQR